MGLFKKSKEGPDLFGNGDTPSLQQRDFLIASSGSRTGITDHIREVITPALKAEVDLVPFILGSSESSQAPQVVDFGGRLLVGGWYRGGDNGDSLAILGDPAPSLNGPEKVAA